MHWILAGLGYLVGALVTALLSLYIYGLRPVYRWRYRHIPGPAPRWLYGNFIESYTLGNHIWQEICYKKYGDVFRVWGLTGPEVTVCSPTLVRQVLMNRNRTPFPSMVQRTDANKDFIDSHILTAKDDKWRSLREAWAPFFYSGSLEQFSERMNYSAKLLCQRLDAVADSSSGQTIDMYPLLADLTMDVIARVSFGVELNTQQPLDSLDADGLRAKQLREDAAYSFSSFGGVNSKWFFWNIVFPDFTWFWRYMATKYPDPPMVEMIAGHKRIMTTVSELIQQHRDTLQAEEDLKVHDSAMSGRLGKPQANGRSETPARGETPRSVRGHDHSTPFSAFDLDMQAAPAAGDAQDQPALNGHADAVKAGGITSYLSGLSSKASGITRHASGLPSPKIDANVLDYAVMNGHTQAAKTGGIGSYPSGLSSKASSLSSGASGLKGGYRSGLATPVHAATPAATPRNAGTPRTPATFRSTGSKPSDLAKQVEGSKKLRKGIQPGSFVDLLVRGYDRDTGKPFSDGVITRQGHAMLLAGFETTASTLAFTTYNLARYPDKAAKLYEEVLRQPAEPNLDSLEQMPYADACLRESLRLYPSAAVGNREAQQDCILGGYKIKKGTFLKCSFWTLHRDPKLWHNPEEFIPERWVEGTEEAAKRPQYAWDGFGDGPRACPGGKLAFEEAKIALVHMFLRFDFRLAPGQVPLSILHNMTMRPKEGVHVTVHRRRTTV